jgi:hypothetical protein
MPSPSRFAKITRRLEDLPSDGGLAVDTLAGRLLRTFIRLGELEAPPPPLPSGFATRCGRGASPDTSTTG